MKLVRYQCSLACSLSSVSVPVLPDFTDWSGAIFAQIGADLGGFVPVQVLDEAEQRDGDHRAQERHHSTRHHHRYDFTEGTRFSFFWRERS